MSENPLIKVIPSFVDKTLEPPAKEIGDVLGNIFFSVFSPINFPMKKYRLRKKIELEQFEEDLRKELAQVKEENLLEPDLDLVGNALESSKFYISSEKHREMFAKLIAKSMNSESIKNVHPSFIEIIKQLSPLDAKNLSHFKKEFTQPIVKYEYHFKENKTYKDFKYNVFIKDPEDDIDLNSTSITNLSRLGLLNITYSEVLSDLSRYDIFTKTATFSKEEDLVKTANSPNSNLIYSAQRVYGKVDRVDIKKGIVNLSPFGKDFIDICINE